MSELALPRLRLGGAWARHLVLAVRVVAGAALAIFALSTPGFTSPLSINALLNAISFIGCVAVGMTFITLTGNIMSLCLGATVSASALIFLASLSFGVLPAFLLAMLFGVVITAYAWCTHRPAGMRAAGGPCACRKPKPGLLFEAAATHAIAL